MSAPLQLLTLPLSKWGILGLVWQGVVAIASLSILFGATTLLGDASAVMFSVGMVGALAYLSLLLYLRMHRSKFLESDRAVRESFHSDQWIATTGLSTSILSLVVTIGFWVTATNPNAPQFDALVALMGCVVSAIIVSFHVAPPTRLTVRATGELVGSEGSGSGSSANTNGILSGLAMGASGRKGSVF